MNRLSLFMEYRTVIIRWEYASGIKKETLSSLALPLQSADFSKIVLMGVI